MRVALRWYSFFSHELIRNESSRSYMTDECAEVEKQSASPPTVEEMATTTTRKIELYFDFSPLLS